MRRLACCSLVTLVVCVTAAAEAAPTPVTVFLDRAGGVVDHDGEEVEIPPYGGGDRAWQGLVGCVKTQFAPFAIDIVETQPTTDHISAVIGGRASMLGLDDRSTNGVGPYIPGQVQRNAIVHIFSQVGTGERDIQNLCAVTVHEVSHALGLDHTFKCGDVMSYFLDRCGPRKFVDLDVPCGENAARLCGNGAKTQNSYRMVGTAVGFRNPTANRPQPQPQPQPELDPDVEDDDPWTDDDGMVDEDGRPADGRPADGRPAGGTIEDDDTTDGTDQRTDDHEDGDDADDDREIWRDRQGNRYTVEHVRRGNRHWVILRPLR